MSGNVIQGPFYNSGFYDTGAGGGGGGGGDVPPYEPPVPDEVEIFEKLFCTSNIGSYDNDKHINVNLLSAISNSDKLFEVDFETKETQRTDGFYFFETDNNISLYWSYNYSNETTMMRRNGGSTADKFMGLSYANRRNIVMMINDKLVNGNTNSIVDTAASSFSSVNIGNIKIPGTNEISANKMFYREIKVSYFGTVLMDLVPAKKNGVPGFYDRVSSNFFSATNSSVWECE